MNEVCVEAVIDAPRARVWERFTDHAGWTDWAGLGKVHLEAEGSDHRNGTGAIRVITSVGVMKVREQVTAWAPCVSMKYTVLSGIPINNHAGEVQFTDLDRRTRTRVVWRCRYETLWGMGALSRAIVKSAFSRVLARLNRQF